MSTCVVSGTITTADGIATAGAQLFFLAYTPQVSGTIVLDGSEVAVATLTDGSFSVALERNAVVRVQCQPAGLNLDIQIPDAATANLADLVAAAASSPPTPPSAFATTVQLTAETARATAAETANASAVTAETTRAESAEGALAAKTVRILVVDANTIAFVKADGTTIGIAQFAELDAVDATGVAAKIAPYRWSANPAALQGIRVDSPVNGLAFALMPVQNGIVYPWNPVDGASGGYSADFYGNGTNTFSIDAAGNMKIATLAITGTAPATPTSPGTAGEIRSPGDGFLYYCIATNSWLRFAGATW